MTILYEAAPAPGPGTHVLAIGVGRYRHLIDGDAKLAAKPLGLGQLASPPVSAKRLVDWCLAPLVAPGTPGFVNAAAPLASVEALISAKAPVDVQTPGGVVQPDPATRDNIQAAFEGWLARLASHPGNIGVFYFCGHGVMVSDHYLLAEDFGRSAAQPWAQAFDVSNTLRAVEREVHGALYFFIDACRVISREVALTLGANPLALKAVDLGKPVIRSSASLIEATGAGKQAFSAAGGQVSRFTDALITALSGYCGVKGAGAATWDVDGEVLANAVRRLLEKANRPPPGKTKGPARQISDQTIGGDAVPLLRLAAVPKVKVELGLTPEQKRQLYELYLTSIKGQTYPQTCPKGIFETEVPRGFYAVGARGTNGALAPIEHAEEELIPPLYGLTIQVP
jgi:hypothetical protein